MHMTSMFSCKISCLTSGFLFGRPKQSLSDSRLITMFKRIVGKLLALIVLLVCSLRQLGLWVLVLFECFIESCPHCYATRTALSRPPIIILLIIWSCSMGLWGAHEGGDSLKPWLLSDFRDMHYCFHVQYPVCRFTQCRCIWKKK
jgi:hypothetical protein